MTTGLVPCSACSRHVKTNEPVCPFCREPRLATAEPRAMDLSPTAQGLSRGALLLAGVAVIAACGKETAPPQRQLAVALYGAPPIVEVDASSPQPDTAPSTSAHADGGAGARTDAGAPKAK